MNPTFPRLDHLRRRPAGGRPAATRRAFSLIELVIVVVIIAIIGAIAIPRMSRGAAGAASSALTADLAVLKSAIDLYQTEHGGTYPGNLVGATGAVTPVDPTLQLTQYTDENGVSSPTKTSVYAFGPYLRTVPGLPVGVKKGYTGITNTTSALNAAGGATDGWVYFRDTGDIHSNTSNSEVDDKNQPYNKY